MLRNLLYNVFSAGILLLFVACGGGSEEDRLLHEAADIHVEALKIKKEMEPNLEELRQISNSIQIQGKALSLEEKKFTDAVNGLERRLQYWEENHIEVPGFEHGEHDHSGHDHHHDHSHDHGNSFQLPASDMLIIQKEFKDSIEAIKSSLELMLTNAPK